MLHIVRYDKDAIYICKSKATFDGFEKIATLSIREAEALADALKRAALELSTRSVGESPVG